MKTKICFLTLLFNLIISQSNYASIICVHALDEGRYKDQVLLNAGFTEDEINNLSDFTKNMLYEDILNSSNFNFAILNLSEDNNNSSAKGLIPSEDLTVILTTSNYKIVDNMLTEVYVKLYYDWLDVPIWRLDDPIFVEWDASLFKYKEGSFYYEDRYFRNGDNLYMSGSDHEHNNNILTWDAHLKTGYFLGIGGAITKLYGYGEFYLQAKTPLSSMDTFLHSMYIHSHNVNVNFTIGNVSGYSFTGTNDNTTRDILLQWNV